ncbi:hypothetical protein [Helicobacter sp. MIT 14-3879]|uniref:hypothetical protein n=1 Tax=Helicobacter sp. MIT 14-3879 TaxID=2040649 RepID=UPI000E1F7BE6|nr:hypothetical protein [Helicobacter sp. MIT 14-3879]RDU65216.1 hypothetical protein CQA44_02570 [Helicobacter sp. MIT 14-3879]
MKRKAFGMIYAIIITVLVATLGILGLKLSSTTLNTTTNEHIAIQLDLYLNSTVELAILYIQRNGFVDNENTNTKRPNVMASIERYINYGERGEYQFKYKMTPLIDNSSSTAQEDQKNVMILDISGSVTNPITNQTLRVTRRQIVKP